MVTELKELARLRKITEEQKKSISKFENDLADTIAYQMLSQAKDSLKKTEERINEVTSTIKTNNISLISETIKGMDEEQRASAFAEFKNNLQNGLSLRVNHSLEYNELDAMNWCQENAKTALKTVLDKKVFEALAKASDIAFVKKIDVPTITIASDLSEYLE